MENDKTLDNRQGNANHDIMRKTNVLKLLNCIRESGPLTKREIQTQTGLSWGAIWNISSELINKEILKEAKVGKTTTGRTPVALDINGVSHFFIGIDMIEDKVMTVIIDMKCQVLSQRKYACTDFRRESILSLIKNIIKELLECPSASGGTFIGIGISMQGAVDNFKGVSCFHPVYEDWENVALKNILEESFELPVIVMHDPDCMALAEKWFGHAHSAKNYLFIRFDDSMGIGIGMSIIINGEVYSGSHGFTGELGHIIINFDESKEFYDKKGMLGMYSTISGIQKTLSDALPNYNLSFTEAACHARLGESPYYEVFQVAGKALGCAIASLANILNPEMVILGGNFMDYSDVFWDTMTEYIHKNIWKFTDVDVRISEVVNGAAIGAAVAVLQQLYNGEIPSTFT